MIYKILFLLLSFNIILFGAADSKELDTSGIDIFNIDILSHIIELLLKDTKSLKEVDTIVKQLIQVNSYWKNICSHVSIVKFIAENKQIYTTHDLFHNIYLLMLTSFKKGYIGIFKILINSDLGKDIQIIGNSKGFLWHPNNIAIIRDLVHIGVNIDNFLVCGQNPLLCTISSNNQYFTILLLKLGINPNRRSENKKTPLIEAVRYNRLDLASILIKKGAAINQGDWLNYSPLIWAIKNKNYLMVKLLIKNGADVNFPDIDKETPLIWAAILNETEIAALLIRKGARVNVNCSSQLSPILYAIRNNNINLVALFISAGANINDNNYYYGSPLLLATKNNNLEMVFLLLEKGAKINYTRFANRNPFFYANLYNNKNMLKALKRAKQNQESQDKLSNQNSHCAIM